MHQRTIVFSLSIALLFVVSLLIGVDVARAAPPELGALQFLPGDTVPAGAWGDQTPPEIARGGSQLLAVWSDARLYEGQNDIYGIRLDAAGQPIGVSFAINTDDGSQTTPYVAWNGTAWLVAFLSDGKLCASRVAADGSVLDTPAIVIATPGAGTPLSLASDGSGWAVLWAGRSAGSADLRGARIAADGTVRDPGGVQILPETYFVRPVGPMAFCKDRYFMTWADDSGVVVLRLTPALQKMDAGPLTIAGTSYFESSTAIAANATEFFITWTESDNSYWVEQIKGSRVSLAGVAAIPAGAPLNENKSGGRGADVAWDGTQWIAAWTGGGVRANRISASGTVVDGTGVLLSSAGEFYSANGAAVAGAPGGGAKVLWQDYRTRLENDIWGASVSATGTAGVEAIVGISTPSQQNPKIVKTNDGYTVAYVSRTSGLGRVMVQRLDANANPIDAEPIEVASGSDVVEPGLAWSGARYLVTWRTRSNVRVFARRLAPDLSFQDATPIQVMVGDNPTVAAVGDVFLVVVENSPGYYQWRDVYAQRLDGATGAKIGGLIGLYGGFAWSATVGTVGNRWLVAWEAHYSHNDSIHTLTYAWVNADGTTSPGSGLVMGSGWSTSAPNVASHSQLGALVYSTTRAPSASNGEIYLLRIRNDGTLLDGYTGVLVTGNANGNQYAPSAAWNGAEFVTAYQDDRASTPYAYYPKSDIYASRIGSDGLVLDGIGGFPVETTPAPERQPAVAGSNGFTLVAASHGRGAGFGSLRIGLRLLIPANQPLPAVQDLRFHDAVGMRWSGAEASTVYDMLRGNLTSLAANHSISDAACLANDLPSANHSDASVPSAGNGFYYLVRADKSGVAPGTYDDPIGNGQAHTRDDDIGTAGCAHTP